MLARRTILYALPLVAAAMCGIEPPAFARPRRRPLFRIERNKNANVVHYDVLLDEAGFPRQSEPLDVYWRMNAEDGRREELSALERSMAYGYSVRERRAPGDLVVSLAAFEARPIRVVASAQAVQALAQIAGHGAVLERLFVQAGGGLIPSVEFVDLFGRSADGRPVRERVRP